MIFGTVGTKSRMETTVISDAVNTASRIEQLTKTFNASILISDKAKESLNELAFSLRPLIRAEVKGKREPIRVFEVLDGYDSDQRVKRKQTIDQFLAAIHWIDQENWAEAIPILREVLQGNPGDRCAGSILDYCEQRTKRLPNAMTHPQ